MCPSVCMNLDISYRYGIEFGKLGKLCIVSEAMFQKGDSIDRAITASLNKFYSIIIFLRKPSLHLSRLQLSFFGRTSPRYANFT